MTEAVFRSDVKHLPFITCQLSRGSPHAVGIGLSAAVNDQPTCITSRCSRYLGVAPPAPAPPCNKHFGLRQEGVSSTTGRLLRLLVGSTAYTGKKSGLGARISILDKYKNYFRHLGRNISSQTRATSPRQPLCRWFGGGINRVSAI